MANQSIAVFKESQTTIQEPFIINKHSFRQLYLSNWEKVYTICFNQTRDHDISMEMVQDIFKSIWERRETLKIGQSIEHYLLRSAKFKVCEYIRNKVVADKHFQHITNVYSDEDRSTENQIAYHELNNQVESLLGKLSFQCSTVYKLSYEQGLNNKEIASSLLISEKTVEYHLSRARSFLQKALRGYRD